jgi:pSer/pThr/pTyr-binding forkhead associated (FHA) protein
MKFLKLTTIVRDLQTATMVAQSFTRSPVLVGRQHGNHLRLDARIVSRRHGAFLFSKDGLRYIDYASANGSYVDGVRVEPNRPIDVRSSSVITIVPFQIVAHIDLVEPRRLSNDPNASTPLVESRPPPATPAVRSPDSALDDSTALRVGPSRESNELWRRARKVMDVVADAMLAAGSRTAQTLSPLRLAATRDELVALLLDPSSGDQRLDELRELLAELLRPRLTSVS